MIDAFLQRRPSASILRRRAVAFLLTSFLATALAAPAAASVAPPSGPGPGATPLTDATTASTMASDILGWLNRDRVAAGLRPLRSWTTMAALANQRSARMAAVRTLSHTAAGGDPGVALTNAGCQWYSYGEIIGETSYPWGGKAAANLYSMWRGSAPHHAIMFSSKFNYIGIGIARASDGTTWSSILFTESVDHSPPTAKITALTRSGTTIRLAWSGSDSLLQSHTAGLRSFDIDYRMDDGVWHLIRDNTTATALSLLNRPHGHSYGFRIQAADRRGNLSSWTAERRIWVP